MSENTRTRTLTEAGVSIWLDDLSRKRLANGSLSRLVDSRDVAGVTTNPSIFQAAISGSDDYDADVASLAAKEYDADAVIEQLTTDDVRAACDVFAEVYQRTGGVDGRVSIEVDPRLAHDTERTIEQAVHLHSVVDRDNVMIKIPATVEGLEAITAVTARGISVNVTLIFSVERYRRVIDAYLTGLEQAAAAGIDLSGIHSVASFFVSRVDTEIDARLEQLGGEATSLRGRAGVANARVAYGAYLEALDSERFRALAAHGANPQRPLWASTGVKNPEYPDTLYVDSLVAAGCVNTMPEKTLEAVADHSVPGEQLTAADAEQAAKVLDSLTHAGIDLPDVFSVLEREGVEKFETAWGELLDAVSAALSAASA